MKRVTLLLLTILIALGAIIAYTPRASASSFNANNLMDDQIFDNTGSMTSAQIDSWLNANFPSSCISTVNGFAAPELTGYTPSGGFTYGFGASAGTVIYEASQAYGINPQVLLTTLEKEESLVSGSNGCNVLRYSAALGYGCPDGGSSFNYSQSDELSPLYYSSGTPVYTVNGTCVNSAAKVGFSEQVIHAAWLLEFDRHRSEGQTNWAVIKPGWDNSDDLSTCYSGFMTQGTYAQCPGGSTAFYDGYATIDSTSVHMETGATAAFYDYTPHFSGNQNFDSIFQNWFGIIYVPSYSWRITNLSYTTGGAPFATGVGGTVTVTAQNMGNVYWYQGGANPVRLGLWGIDGTPIANGGWLSANRPAQLDQSQVAPGNTGTFTFPISSTAPLGTYFIPMNLVVENSQWMPSVGFNPRIQVVSGYNWSLQNVTYSSGGGILQPGGTQHITVTALNTGQATWSKSSGPPIRMGEWGSSGASPVNYNWISSNRAATMDEATVAPGQTGTFEFDVRVPTIGNYYDRLNLVAEGITWFNDASLTLYLRGGQDAWRPLWSAYGPPVGGNANIPRGTSFDVTIKALNTGELPWSNAFGTYPQMRLATVAPQDRGSLLYDSSWLGPTRPATMQESLVMPGQQATFVFHVQIPPNAQPGPRNERFSLVAEGQQWLNDPGFSIYINVVQ